MERTDGSFVIQLHSHTPWIRGTRWRSWLRHCPTSRKVAVSIPDGNTAIFHWHYPSGRTMALGSAQPLTEMSTRNISWGVKAAGAWGWQPYHDHVPIVLKSWSHKLLLFFLRKIDTDMKQWTVLHFTYLWCQLSQHFSGIFERPKKCSLDTAYLR